MSKKYLLAGGDTRHRLMAELLIQNGERVFCYGMDGCIQLPNDAILVETVPEVDKIILPIPVTRDQELLNAPYSSQPILLQDLILSIPQGSHIYGGLFPAKMTDALNQKGCVVLDYGKQEEFAQQNALPTAEGAIEIALHNTDFVLEGARVCVVGYGRIGRVLANKLRQLGCQVTVTARNQKNLEEIKQSNLSAVHTGALDQCDPFNIIFNTVPAPVITDKVLAVQGKQTLIIDLASLPGGVDDAYAQKNHIRCIHALSLPARCAPLTAAQIILSIASR